jgi:hypothetical protein
MTDRRNLDANQLRTWMKTRTCCEVIHSESIDTNISVTEKIEPVDLQWQWRRLYLDVGSIGHSLNSQCLIIRYLQLNYLWTRVRYSEQKRSSLIVLINVQWSTYDREALCPLQLIAGQNLDGHDTMAKALNAEYGDQHVVEDGNGFASGLHVNRLMNFMLRGERSQAVSRVLDC